jgi:hypothetical protein
MLDSLELELLVLHRTFSCFEEVVCIRCGLPATVKWDSNFAQHLIENNHSFGPVDDIMKILYATKKGRLVNNIQKFHVYEETAKNNQINDRHAVKRYVIFETLLKASKHRGRPTGQPPY